MTAVTSPPLESVTPLIVISESENARIVQLWSANPFCITE